MEKLAKAVLVWKKYGIFPNQRKQKYFLHTNNKMEGGSMDV